MRFTRVLTRTPLVLAFAAACALATTTAATGVAHVAGPGPSGYVIKDLGTLGGRESTAVAISNSGYVVGTAEDASGRVAPVRWNPAGVIQDLAPHANMYLEPVAVNDVGTVVLRGIDTQGNDHALVWTPGTGVRDLGTLGGPFARPYDINNAGQIVGFAGIAGGGVRAFLWSAPTGMKNLGVRDKSPSLSMSLANAINDAGQIAGGISDGSDPSAFYRWTPKTGWADLLASAHLPVGTSLAVATDINESGQVAGYTHSYNAQGDETEYVVGWDPKVGVLPMSFTYFTKTYNNQPPAFNVFINDTGQIAGDTDYQFVRPEGQDWNCLAARAFRYDPDGRTHEASVDGVCQSEVNAMNDSGEIIGRSTASGGSSPVARGYVWNPASGSQLRLLAGLGSEQRTNPMAINDAGQIVGSAGVSSDFSHAVRWEPPGGTVTSSVVATADTYANRAAPSTVFGFSSSLAAGLANSSLTYLRFNVPVAPAGRHLVAASLRLHTTTSSSSGSADALEVREASPFWSEAATTWNNRPTTGPDHLGDLAMVAANSYASIRLDQTKVTPGVPLNLVVNGNNADSAQFWSRSYGNTPYRPTLTLIYR